MLVAALLTVIALVAALAVALSSRGGPCVPVSSRDCGCHGDTTGQGLEVTSTDHTFALGGRSSTYRVYDGGVDKAEPVGVVVRLHGDGAYEYDHSPTFLDCLASVAATHNMLFVAPRTPSRDLTWWGRLDRNVDWLDAWFREDIVGLDGVDPGRVWWMGYSGGAEMLTYGLLPQQGDLVTAGALMVGGGGAPTRAADLSGLPLERRPDLPLVWVTGARDDGRDPEAEFDALGASREGAEFYREQGFARVATDFIRDDDHFTIDQIEILHTTLSAQ